MNKKKKARTAVLVSGSGSNLQAIIDAASNDINYPTEIALVISNKPNVYALERAAKAGIKTECIEHGAYESREAFDQAMHNVLVKEHIDYVCLAGFMRLLTAQFVNQWQNKMINIHPSLLPHFKGANAIKQAFEAGVKKTGCSIHIVTPEMDEGPVLAQQEVNITENDTLETLTEKMHKAEHQLYPKTLKEFIEKGKGTENNES